MKFEHELIEVLKERCADAGGQRAFARELGLSRKHVMDMVAGRRPISRFVASKLGYRQTKVWIYDPQLVSTQPSVYPSPA